MGETQSGGPDPLDLLMKKPAPAAPPDRMPESVIYPDIGWAVMRSSWKNDATMLAVKSGFTWNHAHADAGSFLLFHNGVPLITDSGACSYSDRLYVGYYVQSRAHNVILFNGQGLPGEDIRRGVKTPGQVHSLLDGLGLKYVYADATGPMSRYFSRNYRHWLWLGNAILIFDDVRAHEDGRLDWLLHYEGSAERRGNTVALANGQAKAEVRLLHPKELAVREEMGYADHRPQEKVPYLVFSQDTVSREGKFVAAILPEGSGSPEIEALNVKQAIGVRIKQGSEVTDIYLNLQADGRRMHENTNNVIDGWETDAYLFAITRRDKATRYFVSGGSYLRREGRVMLDSLSKVDAVWQPGAKTEVLIQGQRQIEVALGAPEKPASVIVNGRAAQFAHDARAGVVTFQTSGA
jgi:hypothetical protein